MRFVPTKILEQQGCLVLHRARTAVINSIRAYLAEFGIVAAVGRRGVEQLLKVVADPADRRLTEVGRTCVVALGSQLQALKAQILEFVRRIMAWHRSNGTSQRLDAIPVLRWQQRWSRALRIPRLFDHRWRGRFRTHPY
jgi:transposase